jgi:hypothetical protein
LYIFRRDYSDLLKSISFKTDKSGTGNFFGVQYGPIWRREERKQGYPKVFLLSTPHSASRCVACSAKRLLDSPVERK